MKSARLTGLESLFNLRKSTAREMAKQTPFPAPSAPGRRESQDVVLPSGFSAKNAPSGQPPASMGFQVRSCPKGPIKPVQVCKAPGKANLHFGKSILSAPLWKFDCFSRQISLKKTWLFHISWFGCFSFFFFFCWHFYWQGLSRSMPEWSFNFYIFPNSVFVAEKNANKHVNDILHKNID